MKKLIQYSKSALYHIMQNKAYSVFCILGTVLTFILVTFLAQMGVIVGSNYPPAVHADRTIRVGLIVDTKGGRNSLNTGEKKILLENIKEHETFAFWQNNGANLLVNGKVYLCEFSTTNAGFWDVYGFDFIAGRPYTEEDCSNKKHYAVITRHLSEKYFHTSNSVGEKFELHSQEFEITGVTDNFSILSAPTYGTEIWVPEDVFGSGGTSNMEILFPEHADMNRMKEIVYKAVVQTYAQKNVDIQIPPEQFRTIKEQRILEFGGQQSVGFAFGGLLLILLLIPAINIVTLNTANTHNRAEEIAVGRAFGASRLSSFLQIILENLFLVVIGTFLALVLVQPIYFALQHALLNKSMLDGILLIPGVDLLAVLMFIIPLMLVFLLMFSGIPAYLIAKRNIAEVLKGGIK
jgi:ABC-type antimicrobial peptide transport system permease subunit